MISIPFTEMWPAKKRLNDVLVEIVDEQIKYIFNSNNSLFYKQTQAGMKEWASFPKWRNLIVFNLFILLKRKQYISLCTSFIPTNSYSHLNFGWNI